MTSVLPDDVEGEDLLHLDDDARAVPAVTGTGHTAVAAPEHASDHASDHASGTGFVDLSDVAVCAAHRRGRGCALPVLHDREHDDGERTWRRSRRDQRRRDAVADVVERLRRQVAEPLER